MSEIFWEKKLEKGKTSLKVKKKFSGNFSENLGYCLWYRKF